MSLEAIRWALRDAPGVPPQCVSVLVGLAEHADKDGRSSYPSAATLAEYARKGERQVRYDLGVLADAGLIRPGDQSRAKWLPQNRRPLVYDLAVGVQSTAPPEHADSDPGVQSASPRQPTAPQEAPDLQEQGGVQSASPHPEDCQGCNTAQPGVQCTAYKPTNEPKSKASSRRRDLNAGREDVDRLCAHLADRVEANGSLRPEIGIKWRNAARLMLDNDKRTEAQVHKAIDWCQDDEFWRANVMSMPKLRKQYDTLRLRAMQPAGGRAGANGQRPGADARRTSPRDEHRLRR
jgi:hypothetical protein